MLMQAKRAAQQQSQPSSTSTEPTPVPDVTDADSMSEELQPTLPAESGAGAEQAQPKADNPMCDDSNAASNARCKATNCAQPMPSQACSQGSSGTGLDAGIASSECVVCWEAAASVVLQPCGHICACSGCAALLQHSPCPMCRCKVQCSIVLQL